MLLRNVGSFWVTFTGGAGDTARLLSALCCPCPFFIVSITIKFLPAGDNGCVALQHFFTINKLSNTHKFINSAIHCYWVSFPSLCQFKLNNPTHLNESNITSTLNLWPKCLLKTWGKNVTFIYLFRTWSEKLVWS